MYATNGGQLVSHEGQRNVKFEYNAADSILTEYGFGVVDYYKVESIFTVPDSTMTTVFHTNHVATTALIEERKGKVTFSFFYKINNQYGEYIFSRAVKSSYEGRNTVVYKN